MSIGRQRAVSRWTRAARHCCRKPTAHNGRYGTMLFRLLAVALATVFIGPAMAADIRGVTDKEIVIGTYSDMSGVTAMWGVNNTNAWRMVFEEANAEGG